MEIKVCKKCGIEKNIEEFYFLKKLNKYESKCLDCRNKYNQEWNEKNKEKRQKYRKQNIEEKKKIRKTIHRLVAEHILKNNNNYTDVNHIDGNKQNNILTNLEFCNRSYNLKEAYRLKLRKAVKPMLNRKDVLCPNSKKVNQYDLEGNLIKKWNTAYEVSKAMNIDRS